MSDAVDVFLLPQMESTRLTVYELDLSQLFFNWRFDAETNRWTDQAALPEPRPLFELISPEYGELRHVNMSKARGYGLVIIKDAVIVFEFKRSAGSYT